MRIAIASEDFRSITGKAGKARRFLLFEAERGKRPHLTKYLELAKDQPTYHDLHDDDDTVHPLDGLVLITGEAGAVSGNVSLGGVPRCTSPRNGIPTRRLNSCWKTGCRP